MRGQGQPFRGQTLSRPKTGMLEAKDKGHKRKCSPKKIKGLQKFFSGDLQLRKPNKVFSNFPQGFWFFSNKISIRFRKYYCPRAENSAIFVDLRLRGQGLDLRGQSQGLQSVSSRTPALIMAVTKGKFCKYWNVPKNNIIIVTFSQTVVASFRV